VVVEGALIVLETDCVISVRSWQRNGQSWEMFLYRGEI
jgi:hypothetical protein